MRSTSPPTTQDEADAQGRAISHDNPGIPTSEGAITTSEPNRFTKGDVVSDAGTDYISASPDYAWYSGDVAYEQTIDEAEAMYGIELYDEMRKEPALGGSVKLLKIMAMENGLTIVPSHPRPNKYSTREEIAAYDKSAPVADYIRFVIERVGDLDRDFLFTMANGLDCTYKGHKLIEQTAEVMMGGKYGGKLGLCEFSAKPRQNYVFVGDPKTNRLRGVIGKVPGGSIALRTGVVYDASMIANCMAPEKFMIFTVEDRDGDPRGVSWFREPWDPYYRKQKTKLKHLDAIDNFSRGFVGLTAPQNQAKDTYINPYTKKPDTLLNILAMTAARWPKQGGASFPFGTEQKVFFPSGNPAFFEAAFKMYDTEMVGAFLLNSRATQEAENGSKNDTENASNILDSLISYVRRRACSTVTRRCFKWLVMRSFDAEISALYCPSASMHKTPTPDFAGNATGIGQLAASGFAMCENQWDHLKREGLGVPEGQGEPFSYKQMLTAQALALAENTEIEPGEPDEDAEAA